MALASKARLVLTSLGLFVAVFLFSAGNILINSYYAGQLEIINQMEADICIVTSAEDPVTLRETLASFGGECPLEVRGGAVETSILSARIDDKRYLTVLATLQGVSGGTEAVVPVLTEDRRTLPVSYLLVKGRFITDSDIRGAASVVVIDEFTESLLFPLEDGLGQYVRLDQVIGGMSMVVESTQEETPAQEVRETTEDKPLQVVGVIKDSYVVNLAKIKFLGQLNGQSEDNIFVRASVYCPISLVDLIKEEGDSAYFDSIEQGVETPANYSGRVATAYIYSFTNHDRYTSFVEKASLLTEINVRRGVSMQITSKETYLAQAERALEPMKNILTIASLILSIFAGISIMSIVFFSIKERIPEIGIRKAFGASRIDILAQFVFEVVLIALPVSALSILASYGSCLLIKDYLTNTMFVPFIIWTPVDQLLLPLLIGILEALVCSIIPSIYASSIKVTDSLRFD
jgi:putative ABC transport system permease protein